MRLFLHETLGRLSPIMDSSEDSESTRLHHWRLASCWTRNEQQHCTLAQWIC